MNDFKVSFGESVRNNSVSLTNISNVFEIIKTDNSLKENVEKIRQTKDGKLKKDKKVELLPYFVGATFTENRRIKEKLISAEIMILDFDHVGEQYSTLYDSAINDPDTYFAFRSPSGDGLKVGYLFESPVVSNDLYEAVYLKYKEQKEIQYKANADQVTKNASRPCFLSYDSELYVNEDPNRLIVSDIEITPKACVTAKTTKTPITANFVEIENSKTKYVYSAVTFLSKVLQGHDDWMRCGFALACLGEEGRSYFHLLSLNPNYNDSSEFINTKFDNYLQTRRGDIELATLFEIAKKYGFKYRGLTESSTTKLMTVDPKSFADELRNKFKFDDTRDPNKLLGYRLDKFKLLAKNIDGIQPGFYVISADSNVGKTAFLTNVCLDLILTNPEVKVVYFSLDDNKYYTVYRLLSILTQFQINDVRKQLSNANEKNTLDAKRDLILDLVENGRLIVKDLGDLNNISQLVETLQAVGSFENMVVFIDGMYNLNTDVKEGIRMENIARAQTIKEIVDKYNIPVITTGELRKKTKEEGKDKKPSLHDLSETGKYSYNANVVWLLYPLTASQLKEDQSALVLEFAKNKLSDFKGTQDINFIRATGTMEESKAVFVPYVPDGPLFSGGDLD